MSQLRPLQTLKSLGLEFLIPLPVLGLVFWVGAGLVTDRVMSRSYTTKIQHRTTTQLKGRPAEVVLSIKVEIKYNQGFSQVRVKTANSALKKLEFEFPFTEVNQIEVAISRELGLSSKSVRQLVHYQIDND